MRAAPRTRACRAAGQGLEGVLDGQEEHPCLQSPAGPVAGSHPPAALAVMNSQGFVVFSPDLKHVVSGWS